MKRNCEICETGFSVKPNMVKRGRGRFCSRKCKGVWESKNGLFAKNNPNWQGGVGRVTILSTCEGCGKEFGARKTQVRKGQGRFCSRQCKGKVLSGPSSPAWQGGDVESVCQGCEKIFLVQKWKVENGEGKFCSRKCKGKWLAANRSGKDSVHWQGGPTPYPAEWNKAFKRRVRKRDNYTCALCNHYPSREVHHIDYIKEHTVMENCITLCTSCHPKTNVKREYWTELLSPIAIERTKRHGRPT